MAYAIARESLDAPPMIQAFSVRKATKQHGTRKRIEGNFAAGDAVVIVEDVITLGGSAAEAIDAVLEAGGRVLGVLAVVNREQGGREALLARGISVVALTTTSELSLG